jgi:membrane protease subunit HflC
VTRAAALLALLVALGLATSLCVAVIDERELAFRTLLSEPEYDVAGFALNRAELVEPGWYVAIPGLHQLYRYDRRLLRFDAPARELYVAEKLRLEVDYYALWRVADPRRFFEANRTLEAASRQVDNVTDSAVRKSLAQHALADLLSPARGRLQEITRDSDEALRPLGIQVEEVRIRSIVYPEVNLPQVYERMRSERSRVALRLRAEGEQSARELRAKADFDAQVVRAEADREATRLRGEGDAQAAAVYSDAYGRDAEFYSFVRSLEAYRTALDDKTTLVLSPKHPFLRHFLANGVAPKP